MDNKLVLLGLLVISFMNWSLAEDEYPVLDCMDAAYCSLIQGDIAKISEKYGRDPTKYYSEAEKLVAKSKLKDDAALKGCQESYNACYDEAPKMAVEGVNYPEAYRTKCDFTTYSRNIFGCKNMKDWPRAVSKDIPDRLIQCNFECTVEEGTKFTLSNGKVIGELPAPDDRINATDMPDDLEPRYRINSDRNRRVDNDRTASVWLTSSANVNLKDPGWGLGSAKKPNPTDNMDWGEDICPRGTWVAELANLERKSPPGKYPLVHIFMYCKKEDSESITAFVLSKMGTKRVKYWSGYVEKELLGGDTDGQFKGYYERREEIPCPPRTFITGVSLTNQTINAGPFKGEGVYWVNYKCEDPSVWKYGPTGKVDSTVMECPVGQGVCGLHTRTSSLGKSQKGSELEHITDIRIACCTLPKRNTTTSTPAPPTTVPVGEEGILKLQQGFIMIWGQVLMGRITRYNYLYTPNTIVRENDWETTKCVEGTFVNWFEVTNPVSNYFWTRRIFQIKFKCAKRDGSGSNDLDLYKKLTTGWNLTQAEAEVTGTNNCTNGYYNSVQLSYYLDKPRVKLALVNAWSITMKCSKGGAIEPHKHIINSTPMNKPEENEVRTGEVDCGTGKAICGFSNKIIDNRKGAIEGIFYKVVCCSV